MTPVYHLQSNACIRDWLIRVDTQYDETTPKKVKEADYDRARKSLGLGNVTNNYFFSSPQPLLYIPPQPSRGWFSSGDTTTNSHNTTYVDNSTHIHNNAPVELSSDNKKKKIKEEKTNWKGIAAIGVVSTAVAGISIFVYARLAKAAEGAVNYLENTKNIQQWARGSAFPTKSHNEINQIACTQLRIDQRNVDKITNYKHSILTSLVGTLAIAGGGIAILASPALATAGTTAVIVGGILNSIAVMYAAYNCGMHWSDQEEGKKVFNEVKWLIPDLIKSFESGDPQSSRSYSYDREHPFAVSHEQQPAYNDEFLRRDLPPSYDESQGVYQAIYNQRARIYPDLRATAPVEMQELSRTEYKS